MKISCSISFIGPLPVDFWVYFSFFCPNGMILLFLQGDSRASAAHHERVHNLMLLVETAKCALNDTDSVLKQR